jgi:hypothetical protein
MKTIWSFLIAGVLLLTQSLHAGPRGGGVGFGAPVVHAPAPVTTAPIARTAPNFHPTYSPVVRTPRTLPGTRTYVPRSTIASGQGSAGRSTITLGQRGVGRSTIASGQPGTGRSTTTRNAQNGQPRANDRQAVQRDRHQSHDRDWWRQHFPRIVLFGGGYYYWDIGYWYPAWGYDPSYTYDNDGPIYAYGDLLPDQVISNVQIELQQEGYYAGPINGSLDQTTRAAIATYQRDRGLNISGTVDETTVEALGLG